MYLRLGNTKINYSNYQDDFLIFSEVVSSGMGYESPVLVRSTEELDIWFGQDYEERSYLRELLKNNVTLYLSQPVSPLSGSFNMSEWIDYENFPYDPGVYFNEDQFPLPGQEGIRYKKLKEITGIEYEEYIWTGEFYIAVQDLPQNNCTGDSRTFLNRDTLTICSDDSNLLSYHQYYIPEEKDIEENSIGRKLVKKIKTADWKNVNLEEIEKGNETLAYTYSITLDDIRGGGYVVLSPISQEEKGTLIYSGELPALSNNYYSKSIQITSPDSFISAVNSIEGYWVDSELGVIWCEGSSKVTYFYSWGKFELIPNYEITQDILELRAEEDEKTTPLLKLWSRTCGRWRDDEYTEDNINITIEYTSTEGIYRALISRYDYVEVFEGFLYDSPYRLDYMIEQGSKLVHAEITYHQVYQRGKEDYKKLPEGTWELRRAKVTEENDTTLYKNAIKMIFEEGGEYYMDFFLIPHLDYYVKDKDSAEKFYTDLLEISNEYSLQFLIQNDQTNLEWNYTKDVDNRLVWFYGEMTVQELPRPSYYAWIRGLLVDQYSVEAKDILYLKPEINNPYEETDTEIEVLLKKYKSNYLVFNNQIYYYKEYQNGEKYYTTIWMRFTMGKITRQLERKKGIYLGNQTVGGVIEGIKNDMKAITDRFSIIRSISLEDYEVNYRDQKMSLQMYTTISDLMQNNMSLDVTINYNKT